MLCLAHGANDVANTVSPFAIIFTSLEENIPLKIALRSSIEQKWALIGAVVCSVGLIIGIVVLGTRVLITISKGIVSLKLSSGFAAQLSCATVTIIGTYLTIPLSTTNMIVLSIIAVGIVDSKVTDPNLKNEIYPGGSADGRVVFEESREEEAGNARSMSSMSRPKERLGSWSGKHGQQRWKRVRNIFLWWLASMVSGGILAFAIHELLWFVVK